MGKVIETTGIKLITKERERQIKEEGWDYQHDQIGNNEGQLIDAAICYALPEDGRGVGSSFFWPWDRKWWKPTPEDRVRELTKAGALIAAEIDRLIYGQ